MRKKKFTYEEMINGCLLNDPDAQAFLYDKYFKKLRYLSKRYFHALNNYENNDIVEDCVIETLMTVFQKISTHNDLMIEYKFWGWIRRILINNTLIVIRQDKYLKTKQSINSWDEMDNFQIDRLSHHFSTDINIYNKIIDDLTPPLKSTFKLHIDGYKFTEIAKMLNITESTSKVNYKRAKEKIQEKLQLINITKSNYLKY